MNAVGEHDRIPLILVIDDDRSTRLLIRQAIERAGLRTAEAEDGTEGLKRFLETGPDLVILDVLMPGISALDVCRQIRSLPQGEHTPVLIMTDVDDAGSIEAAYAAGATDLLRKPVNWTLFHHRIRYILRSARTLLELKQAGEGLRESEEQFRMMFRAHDAVMLLLEPESGRIIDINQSAESYYGYPAGAMKKMSIQDINMLSPEEIAVERENAKNRKRSHFIFPHRLASGEVRTVEVYSSPILIRQKQLLFSIIHDITERVQAEKQLADAHVFNEQILSASPVGIATFDSGGQCISINDRGVQLIGATKEQVLSQNFRRLESWKKSGLLEHAEKALATGEQTRCIIYHTSLSNRTIWIDCLFSTFSARGTRHLLLAFTDITERKETEAKIRKLLSEQQIIMDNIAVGIGYFVNRTVVWSNNALNRMFGFSVHGLNGRDTREFYPDLESYQKVGREAYAVVDKGSVFNTDVQMQKQDGTLFWCNIVGQAVDRERPEEGSIWMLQDITEHKRMEEELADSYNRLQTLLDNIDAIVYVADMQTYEILLMNRFAVALFGDGLGRKCWEVLQKGQTGPCPFCTNDRLVTADGTLCDTYVWEVQNTANGRWYECRDKAVRWIDNRIVRMEIAADITEMKAARQELVKIEKLESVGILAGGIAHDFNNLLQAILGNITMAKLQGVSEEQRIQWLSSAEQACEMAHELTKRLIIFSKGGDPVKGVVRLDTLLRDAVGPVLAESPVLQEYTFPEDSISVVADRGQLRQVFRNLAINAKEAMPQGGRLVITARVIVITGRENLGLPPGAYAEIIFSDSGSGIPPEALGKVFDPYFSTKERGAQKGMGLGLPISSAVIRKHGGRITVESELGKGTTFHIYLPAAVGGGINT